MKIEIELSLETIQLMEEICDITGQTISRLITKLVELAHFNVE